ncbi:MAG TPA: monofunctional biosynthetic peptidoglycan transglycosylase [Parafilimonas sp.]|nr:monofunctional biosynthetic peptidoglycan transglycosylase [Parafilimonas sp.]
MKVRKQSLIRSFLRRLFKVILYGFILSLVYLLLCKWLMPPVTITQLGSRISGYGLKRDYVSWDDINANAKLAAIAGEDQLFPVHNGFDWKAISRSFDNNSSKSKRPAGSAASTISQQTAKNVFLFQGEGVMRYVRKPLEAVYTKLIEWVWGKQRILEVYLNTSEMGPGIFGIEAASREYFSKSAKELNRNEAAMIIAGLPNPKLYTVKPVSRFVNWKSKWILRQMANVQADKNIQALIYKK